MSSPTEDRRRAVLFASQIGGKGGSNPGPRKFYSETLAARIPRHRGAVVSEAGDFLLAEFDEAASAINCAIDLQERCAQYDRLHLDEGTIEAKIAVHFGEASFADGRPSGAGIETVTELVSAAPPGKIYITREVYARVRMLLQLKFEPVPASVISASIQSKEILSVAWEAVTGNLEASLKKLGEDDLQRTQRLSSKFGFSPSKRASPVVLIFFFLFIYFLLKILKWV